MVYEPIANPMTKHVGTYNDKRCVIVLQLPEQPNLVHIVDTEQLPMQIHQNLMDIIALPESQSVQWLGEVLNRRMLSDGTNALRTLYEKRYIQQVNINSVMLSPRPNVKIPLTEVLGMIQPVDPLAAQQDPVGQLNEEHARLVAEEQAKMDAGLGQVPTPVNQHASNLASDQVVQNQHIANNLIMEAQMLEADAASKRAQAAQYAGVQAPVTPVVPTVVPTDTVGGPFVDTVTGREYKSASALKGAVTRRTNAANG